MSSHPLMRERSVDVEQARQHYAALVDKKFTSSLTQQEEAELLRLGHLLDEAEAEFYRPSKDKLKATLAALSDEAVKG